MPHVSREMKKAGCWLALALLLLLSATYVPLFLDSKWGLYFGLWAGHVLLPLAFSIVPLIGGWHRAQWRVWELLALVVPFGLWLTCMEIDSTGKSLANFGECLWISLGLMIAVGIRVAVGRTQRPWLLSGAMLLALCAIAIGAYALTPGLPE